jgi:prepilin-type N-terminal cleavage/methylation domain-containing protein
MNSSIIWKEEKHTMRRWGEKGLTLLEVLVAMAILGVLMGGLLTLMQTENQVIRSSAELLSAKLKANEVMERTKAMPFGELKSFSTLIVSELKQMTVDVHVSDFSALNNDEEAAIEGLKKIVVRVTWFDQHGRERQYVLTTLRTRYHQRSHTQEAL